MNDELPEDQRPKREPAGSSSRWAVAPGSVVKSIKESTGTSRHAAPDDDMPSRGARSRSADETKPATARGRTAADILAEARSRHGGAPDPASAYTSTRTSARSATGSRQAPPKIAASNAAASSSTIERRRASAERITPDLGEPRELRQSPAASTQAGPVLAGFGGVVLIIITTGIGALIDHMISSKLGVFTGIGLCIGAFFAALVTRKLDLLSVIAAPPIIYALYGVLLIWLSPTAIDKYALAEIAITGFPWMALATGIALIIGGIKLVTTRPTERR